MKQRAILFARRDTIVAIIKFEIDLCSPLRLIVNSILHSVRRSKLIFIVAREFEGARTKGSYTIVQR